MTAMSLGSHRNDLSEILGFSQRTRTLSSRHQVKSQLRSSFNIRRGTSNMYQVFISVLSIAGIPRSRLRRHNSENIYAGISHMLPTNGNRFHNRECASKSKESLEKELEQRSFISASKRSNSQCFGRLARSVEQSRYKITEISSGDTTST